MVTEKFGYDANGSLTTRQNGSNALLLGQGYDLKNRLVEADVDGDGGADLRLAYDHQEGRVARHELDGSGAVTASEHYLLDRMNPTGYEQVLEQAEALDDVPARSFLLGLSLILQADGSTLRSFLYDGHGTNRALVDATGQIASSQILAYDAFGVRTDAHSSVLTPIQYTGQWFDALLGQGYHRHRYLSHADGVWNAVDSFEGEGHYPLTLHKYLYGQSNPIALVDFSGNLSIPIPLGVLFADLLLSIGLRLYAFAPYIGAVGLLSLGAYAAISYFSTAAVVQDQFIDWLSSGEPALVQAASLLASRAQETVNAVNLALTRAVNAGLGILRTLSQLPLFPVIQSTMPDIYTFDVAALAFNPKWALLTYNGPRSIATLANRAVVWLRHGWKMQGAPGGYQLDEFPYASTTQGGRGPPAAWGQPVPALQNQVQGGLLSALYRYSLKSTPLRQFLVVPVPI